MPNPATHMSMSEAVSLTGTTVPEFYGWCLANNVELYRTSGGTLMVKQEDLTSFAQSRRDVQDDSAAATSARDRCVREGTPHLFGQRYREEIQRTRTEASAGTVDRYSSHELPRAGTGRLSLNQAAQIAGVPHSTIQGWIQRRELPVHIEDGVQFILATDLEKLMHRSTDVGQPLLTRQERASMFARDECVRTGRPEDFQRHYEDALREDEGDGMLGAVALLGRDTPRRPLPDTRF